MQEAVDQFIKDYEGKTVGYPGNLYLGECLSLVKHYIKRVFNIDPPASGCGAARCYWSLFPSPLESVFKKIAYVSGMKPKKGWIAVWNANVGGGYGHIGIVLEADENGFTSLDQNWGGRHAHKVEHDYNNLYGFLAPLEEGEEMSNLLEYLGVDDVDQATDRLAEHLGEKEGKSNWGSEPKPDEPNEGGHLGAARAAVTALKKGQKEAIDQALANQNKVISRELGLPNEISETSELIRAIKGLIEGQSDDQSPIGNQDEALLNEAGFEVTGYLVAKKGE